MRNNPETFQQGFGNYFKMETAPSSDYSVSTSLTTTTAISTKKRSKVDSQQLIEETKLIADFALQSYETDIKNYNDNNGRPPTPNEWLGLWTVNSDPKPFDYSFKTNHLGRKSISDPIARENEECRQWWLTNLKAGLQQIERLPKKPHLPKFLWEKVALSEYVNLEDFTKDGIASLFEYQDFEIHQWRQTSLIHNWMEWSNAFRIYQKAVTILYPHRHEELCEYDSHIIQLTTQYPFESVYNYDMARRLRIVEDRTLTLKAHQSDLRLHHLISQVMFKTEHEQDESDQMEEQEICINWNKGRCSGPYCKRAHECLNSECGGDHPKLYCPIRPYTFKNQVPCPLRRPNPIIRHGETISQ
ncbi:4639_t:CDS:2 [Funneliformis geosporum]|uniref:1119_t:CDS:1 n=1 Tax=Funneliformis geosporum TaxID=1117311 RepID=A0A9W4WRL2_9GLOM|nr:1119_t:CDS:2 [Funneliformis geosporum]CAI2192770.1 4639_t:CDS:2 [Funneliformis geosporum]